ncbi:hypothetical protein, partial [Xanthomonas translucens]|uniref:hypothetical protein n=1 Tax=Xanthomonas campestris pv. translucens TaxID=343 RepID=UPI001C3FF738
RWYDSVGAGHFVLGSVSADTLDVPGPVREWHWACVTRTWVLDPSGESGMHQGELRNQHG